MAISFTNLALVAAVAFLAPLALGLVPALRLPAVVLEIVLGIVVGAGHARTVTPPSCSPYAFTARRRSPAAGTRAHA